MLHKSSERSSLVSGPRLNSSPLGAKNPGVIIQQQPFRTLQARILEWVAMPFSRGSSGPRDRTRISYVVSCIVRWVFFFTTRATWEAFLINQSQECLSSCQDNEQGGCGMLTQWSITQEPSTITMPNNADELYMNTVEQEKQDTEGYILCASTSPKYKSRAAYPCC